MRAIFFTSVLLVFTWGFAEQDRLPPYLGNDWPSYITIGAGAFNFHKETKAAQLQLEFRYRPKFKRPAPLLGVTATHKGTFFIYGGFVFDLFFSDTIILTPAFAAGYYEKGGGKDLGYPLEFRSCIELAYQFPNRSRLGIQLYHLSNASISHKNPGEESLLITYGIPIR